MSKRNKFSDCVFDVFNYIFLIMLALFAILPMLNVLAKSFSSEKAINSGSVTIFPVDFTFDTYRYILTESYIQPFLIQLIITVGGTVLSLILLIMLAYPLSRRNLAFKQVILVIMVFTMVFNPGLIPNYILIKKLGLLNNLLSLILPVAFSGFNVLLVKSYMESIPDAVTESAIVEGANHLQILILIIIPFSVPVIATMVLFNAVGYWNSYFGALMYITKFDLKPLQLFLRELVLETEDALSVNLSVNAENILNTSPESVRATAIISTTVPILLVYPLLQKYYIKGIMIGSVKG